LGTFPASRASDDVGSVPFGPSQGWSEFWRVVRDEPATRVLALEPQWVGPIPSTLGLHLVWVHERIPGAMPPLDLVRPQVVRALAEERAVKRVAGGIQRLRSLYEVRVEPPAEMASAGWSLARQP
jgi:hypothetical protein